jgi:hypothetical protein
MAAIFLRACCPEWGTVLSGPLRNGRVDVAAITPPVPPPHGLQFSAPRSDPRWTGRRHLVAPSLIGSIAMGALAP